MDSTPRDIFYSIQQKTKSTDHLQDHESSNTKFSHLMIEPHKSFISENDEDKYRLQRKTNGHENRH